MKYFILFLFLTGTVFGLDTKRVGTHTINENLSDTLTYADYFYGDYANLTRKVIESYDSELDYIKDRAGSLIISRWAITYFNDTIILNVTGIYPNFVIKEGNKYKIDSRGFIDELCTAYPYSSVSKIEQEFDFDIVLPPKLVVLSTQKNASEDLSAIFYNLTVTSFGNTIHKSVRLVVKNNTSIFTYCAERDRLDRLLKEGIVAQDISETMANDLPWIIAILFILCLSLAYLVRR